jgi:putative SOS response-associated peptidase YedK
MCGRLGITASAGELQDYLNASVEAAADHAADGSLQIPSTGMQRYNLAPSRQRAGNIILERLPALRQIDGQRRLDLLVWPLIPFWAHGALPKYHTANCRSEVDWPFSVTVRDKPAYRGAWQRDQRCLIPASWFYEWNQHTQPKTPYRVYPLNQPMFTFAGLWDRSSSKDGTVTASCTIITTAPNQLLADIGHHRAPVIIEPPQWDTWLDGSKQEAEKLLQPPPADEMAAVEVSKAVNNPEYDDAALLQAVKS